MIFHVLQNWKLKLQNYGLPIIFLLTSNESMNNKLLVVK